MGLMVFNGDGMGLNGHLVGFNEISWDLMRFKNGDLMRFNGKIMGYITNALQYTNIAMKTMIHSVR